MLESDYGLSFFLKCSKKKSDFSRYVYLRVTVDGVPKETSTKKNETIEDRTQSYKEKLEQKKVHESLIKNL